VVVNGWKETVLLGCVPLRTEKENKNQGGGEVEAEIHLKQNQLGAKVKANGQSCDL